MKRKFLIGLASVFGVVIVVGASMTLATSAISAASEHAQNVNKG
ncbi:hypothetical protein QUD65_07755 [Lacticaseibacillus paracasei]|nr:hypothetical protein [Lacticaseibacillus paracasei]MDM7549588.1 hypothetical protein [Lacticaseibacillus paracasei]